jgi:hypothetical protein
MTMMLPEYALNGQSEVLKPSPLPGGRQGQEQRVVEPARWTNSHDAPFAMNQNHTFAACWI